MELTEIRNRYFEKLDCFRNEFQDFQTFLELRTKDSYYDFCESNGWRFEGYNLSLDSGETKVLIIFDDEDWVIKIPFDLTKTGTRYDDFCRIEAKNYQRAIEESVEKFFVPMYFLGDYEFEDGCCDFSCPIYIMEKVDVNEDVNSTYAKSNYEGDEDDYDDYDFSGEDGAMICLESSWTVDETINLWDFLCKYDINDVHTGNIGLNFEGKYVICDYSGY